MSNTVATKVIDFIEPRLNRRSVAFLLCLLLAGLFWLLTSLSNTYVDEVSVPLVYNGIPDDMLVVNEQVNVVNAEVKGLGFDLMWYWLQFEKFEIPVDAIPSLLPSIKKNGSTYHYILTEDKASRLGNLNENQLEILEISPDTLFLKFVAKHLKQVPVKLNAEISFQKQFGMVSEPILIPDSVLLIGAKEEIDTISFVKTARQTWNELNESLTAEVLLQPFKHFPFIEMSQTNVQVELNVVEFTEGSVLVPLTVVADKPEAVKVFPHEVEIKYQVSLKDYDKVTPSQFEATVVLDNQSLTRSSLTVNVVRQPKEATQLRINPAAVEFIIQK